MFLAVHGVEHVVLYVVVLLGDLWRWLVFQVIAVCLQKRLVGLIGFLFDLLIEVVGGDGIGKVEYCHNPKVEPCNMLSKESVNKTIAATEFFPVEKR